MSYLYLEQNFHTRTHNLKVSDGFFEEARELRHIINVDNIQRLVYYTNFSMGINYVKYCLLFFRLYYGMAINIQIEISSVVSSTYRTELTTAMVL